ncbi:MAG: hypothetical protein M1830_002390 [Pleopsidium flavum]|nr:MAG: hypothetical protein M1830_002390 [Pleopsidium flavum]
MSVSATMVAAGKGEERGLSGADIAGITIGTVAVVAFIVFGAGFLVLRHKKHEARVRVTTPHTTAMDTQPVADCHGENVQAEIPTWPVEVDGDHELRHWTPQELGGGEIAGNKEDGAEPEAKDESTVVDSVENGNESRDSEQIKAYSAGDKRYRHNTPEKVIAFGDGRVVLGPLKWVRSCDRGPVNSIRVLGQSARADASHRIDAAPAVRVKVNILAHFAGMIVRHCSSRDRFPYVRVL